MDNGNILRVFQFLTLSKTNLKTHASMTIQIISLLNTIDSWNKKFKMIYFQTIIDLLAITFLFIFKIYQLPKIGRVQNGYGTVLRVFQFLTLSKTNLKTQAFMTM